MRNHARWIAALALLALPSLAGSAAATQDEMAVETVIEQEMAPDAAEEETLANGHVARALFTTLVADREPQDDVSELTNENVNVMFFTDLRDLQGQTVSHVWKRDGNVMARVPFAVQGPRWRVYSTKNLEPSWTGTWTVTVVDANGQELHSDSFSYVATATAAEPAEETAPPAAMPME